MFMIFGGKLFQSLIVLGQKLYLYSSHDVCTGIRFIGSEFLVFITVLCFTSRGILIAAWPCSVLYIKVSLFTFLLCSNVGQLRWFSAWVTHPSCLEYVLVAKRKVRRCICSNQDL